MYSNIFTWKANKNVIFLNSIMLKKKITRSNFYLDKHLLLYSKGHPLLTRFQNPFLKGKK